MTKIKNVERYYIGQCTLKLTFKHKFDTSLSLFSVRSTGARTAHQQLIGHRPKGEELSPNNNHHHGPDAKMGPAHPSGGSPLSGPPRPLRADRLGAGGGIVSSRREESAPSEGWWLRAPLPPTSPGGVGGR